MEISIRVVEEENRWWNGGGRDDGNTGGLVSVRLLTALSF